MNRASLQSTEFRPEGFRFTKGEPKLYRSSEWLQSGVCSTGGSPLVVIYDEDPAPVIFVGSLDHPDEKVSWHVISDDMPQFALNYPEIPEGQGGTS